MNLTHEDVQEILKLLQSAPFDELNIETDRFKLSLRRSGAGWTQAKETTRPAQAAQAVAAAKPEHAAVALEPGTVAIHAPLVGTFYRAPQPGAEPFVTPGSHVEADSVIAIIETMKLMNTVRAGARGTIADIRVENAEFVEHGRVLMTLRLAAP